MEFKRPISGRVNPEYNIYGLTQCYESAFEVLTSGKCVELMKSK
jgi:hypothetical protein